MEEKIERKEKEFFDGEVKDQIIIRETRDIIIKNVPVQLWEDYRDFCRKHAKGNWATGLQIAVNSAKFVPILSIVVEKVDSLDQKLMNHIEEESEKEGERAKTKKTFGGARV